MKQTEARLRANRAWIQRKKDQGICIRGCGKSVKGQLNVFGKPRVGCVECTKKNNQKHRYKTKVERASAKIQKLSKIIELQHEVIAKLREQLRHAKSTRQNYSGSDQRNTQSQIKRLCTGEQSVLELRAFR